jgi:murein DD-endopeptidase MepM/ murein hydrolase activator NlpD
MADDRRMTFIVVPHDRGLETRSFEVSYRRLRTAGIAAAVLAVVVVVMAASWLYLAAQAARVPGLQEQVTALSADRQRLDQLQRLLARMEEEQRRVRVMLGVEEPVVVELERPGTADPHPEAGERGVEGAGDGEAVGPQSARPGRWPLEARGFVTRGHLAAIAGRHPGVDIAVPTGTRILAAGAGTVAEVGEDSVYGRFVRIAHPEGYESLYAHASSLLVRPHQRVREGEAIGLSGSTGVSTAPHLHFEIRKDGRPVDPGTMTGRPE